MLNETQLNWLRYRFNFNEIDRLAIHGSVREYYRLKRKSDTRIAVLDKDKAQLQSFIRLEKLFEQLDVNIPHIYEYSEELGLVLEQDVGDCSVETICQGINNRVSLYKQIIDILISWQERFSSMPESTVHGFLPHYNFDFARNETRLFSERFLKDYLDLADSKCNFFNEYFDDLAVSTCRICKVLMHRDFQGRNIHIYRENIYFIDYQAAMLGPNTYDIAALIYDNHVNLSIKEKSELLHYFLSKSPAYDYLDFQRCAIQRTLQALSAYAFFCSKQSKIEYEQYIPIGLEHLRELSDNFEWLTELLELIQSQKHRLF